jgi:hypothetical protein
MGESARAAFGQFNQTAKRWANHVNKSTKVKAKWSYLLAFEADVKQAAGSWSALKKLAS